MAIDIDINTIKKMPLKMKAVVVLVAFLLIGYFYWYLFLSSALGKKSSLNVKLSEIQTKIKEQEKLASQLDKYMADVKALQENYKIALQKLPDQREIPNLFHSVASVGKEAGIEFLLFQPKAPVPKGMDVSASAEPKTAALLKPSDQRGQKPPADAQGKKGAAAPAPEPFYEEIPVAVSVVGSFQNILYFFNKVAHLPRIINISDITMSKDSKTATQLISSTFTIKTYMFIEKK
ncbi:MAG: type 4a pilus biogenesis protein PilO, partial [Syntrophaceae bacterium]|nr:type 4a pilus biogenesis protein PilO [Syntrophaceae bacterium]